MSNVPESAIGGKVHCEQGDIDFYVRVDPEGRVVTQIGEIRFPSLTPQEAEEYGNLLKSAAVIAASYQ